VRFVVGTCSLCSAAQPLGQIWSFSDQCDWESHGWLRRTTYSSRHWSDRMTCPPTKTSTKSTVATPPTNRKFGLRNLYQFHFHTGLHAGAPYHLLFSSRTLLRAGTTRNDAGHWRYLRTMVDRGNSCRRGDCHSVVWTGAPRSGAANNLWIWEETLNSEDCRLAATADRVVPDCTAPSLIHLTVVRFCTFLLFILSPLPLFSLSSRVCT